MMVCTMCHEKKPLKEFRRTRGRGENYVEICRVCAPVKRAVKVQRPGDRCTCCPPAGGHEFGYADHAEFDDLLCCHCQVDWRDNRDSPRACVPIAEGVAT
jgi:hypothetical protein